MVCKYKTNFSYLFTFYLKHNTNSLYNYYLSSSICLTLIIHVKKYMTLTRFLLYRAMLGNAILLLLFFLYQKQNYFERVKKTPSVTTEIRITFFFSILKAHQCYIMKGKTISPRLSLTVPNKYANFVGLVRKPWNQRFMQGFANYRLFW